MSGLEQDPSRAVRLCTRAHDRLLTRVAGLDDAAMRAACLLPGWSVGHVLTHLARNADGHARRIEGALAGTDTVKYPGGARQRAQEIESGAIRPAAEIIDDLRSSQGFLDSLFAAADAAGWPNAHFRGGGDYGVGGCPAHRLREVEMHHVDLGLGYHSDDWPEEYVDWDLHVLLATVPDRLLSPHDRRTVLAWLAGRATLEHAPTLEPWG
ncbi:MAG: maleylpyruvate isomerase N-terminal domain-containing protein [Candidatus Nanopelagicales bacterium]